MDRKAFIDLLKRVSYGHFSSVDSAKISKAMGFYFLKKFVDLPIDDMDFWNSDVDASNDRGIDYVYVDDSSESVLRIYIIQCKYSEDGAYQVNEGEVSTFLQNSQLFPNIPGTCNPKLSKIIEDVLRIKAMEEEIAIETVPIYVCLGTLTANARSQLDQAGVDIYDFERINSELLLDQSLPTISIQLKQAPLEYSSEAMIGILNAKSFFEDVAIGEMIQNQKIFHFNVRGLMSNRKNSIAEDIRRTAQNSPELFFTRNNGITIICESKKKEETHSYILTNASIINGQQTVRALHGYWGSLSADKRSKIHIPAKIITISSQTGIAEINTVAKSTNKQNPIRESDLFSNEIEQNEIEEKARYLPQAIKFTYARKRSFNYPDAPDVITRDQATLLLSLFLNQNPSDRIESLYKGNYKYIFERVKPEHIALIKKIRDAIEGKQAQTDKNNQSNKVWEDMFYRRFKKYTVINYCLYLLSHLLDSKFGKQTRLDRMAFLDQIYDKMIKTSNFDINSYFNIEFWLAFQMTTYRYIHMLYTDQNVTNDALRKEANVSAFISKYEDFITEKAIEGTFQPCLVI